MLASGAERIQAVGKQREFVLSDFGEDDFDRIFTLLNRACQEKHLPFTT